MHRKSDEASLRKKIPKEILPTEYGGDAGPIQDMIGMSYIYLQSLL